MTYDDVKGNVPEIRLPVFTVYLSFEIDILKKVDQLSPEEMRLPKSVLLDE